MPVLGICGDSFMAATLNGDRQELVESEGKHFTEILAKRIGYDYFTLARGACSNTAIRLQIDEMIKQKVDLVIINSTSPNRLEIPNLGRKFDHRLGVYNLDYRTEFYPDRSTLNPNFKHNTITDTLTNIFYDPIPFYKKVLNPYSSQYIPKISKEQLDTLGSWYDYLYDESYKIIMDSYIMLSGIKALEANNIKFVMLWNFTTFAGVDSLKNDYRIITQGPLFVNTWETGYRRWHTTDLAQEKGAELWYNYLVEHGYLTS